MGSKQCTCNTNHPSFIFGSFIQLSNLSFPQQACYWFVGLSLLMFFKPESLEPVPEDKDVAFSDDTTGVKISSFLATDILSLHDRSQSNALSTASTTKTPAAVMGTITKNSSSKSRMQRASHGSGESIHQLQLLPSGLGRGQSMRVHHHLQILLVRCFGLLLWTKWASSYCWFEYQKDA